MTVDWITIAVAIGSALVTALVHSSSQAASSTTTSAGTTGTPTAGQPSQGLGLFHGGLLARLRGSSATPASSGSTAPTATSHPVISSLLSILESEIGSTQGQQLLSQLSSALITLTGSNGQQIAVQAGSASSSGGTTNATSASGSPASAGS
jgi:hypothetical protein